MRNKLFQIGHFINHYFTSKTKYSVHSPLLFKLIVSIIDAKNNINKDAHIEKLKQWLKKSNKLISIVDYGTGKNRKMPIKQLIRRSVSASVQSILLARIIHHFKSETIVELGTCAGFNAAYLSRAGKNVKVYTIEGCEQTANLAGENIDILGIKNVEIINNTFEEAVLPLMLNLKSFDVAYIDGNHSYLPTVSYVKQFLQFANSKSIIIIDDIYWSKDMLRAWRDIIKFKEITLSVDLYHFGILFLNPQLSKQDLKVKISPHIK